MVVVFVFIFASWLLSLSFHEFSHALIAYWGGDKSVKDKGYLTFNPLKYTHPVYSFLLPLLFLAIGGIGLPGGAVYINERMLRGRKWRAAVSIAGPVSNAILAVLLAVPFAAGLVPLESDNWLWPALAFLCMLQVTAVLFNLVPIPPLDGYGFVSEWIPWETKRKIDAIASQAYWLFLMVLLMVPQASNALWTTVHSILGFIGVPPQMAWEGFQLARFWS